MQVEQEVLPKPHYRLNSYYWNHLTPRVTFGTYIPIPMKRAIMAPKPIGAQPGLIKQV